MSPTHRIVIAFLGMLLVSVSAQEPPRSAGDAAFTMLADEFVRDYLRRHPTEATYLGVHEYDEQLDDYSREAVGAEVAALTVFRKRIEAADPAALSLANQLDRQQLLLAIDSRLLDREVIRPWANNPDLYSSGITETAFVMVKRDFAPLETRLRALIARERRMPEALQHARTNLVNPPAVYTDIAIEQIDGNREFFAAAVPAAFASIAEPGLLKEFRTANQAVVDALGSYKEFLEKELRPRSKGRFAIGASALARKFVADEMVELPLDKLLHLARADLARNQAAARAVAARIAPDRSPAQAFDTITSDHPEPARLLEATQGMLDSLRTFIESRGIVTIPKAVPARVEETPPFMRATTSASMDTPGPFETRSTEAYYNMTLPDPAWPPDRIASFMKQWYYPAIANVSVHEVYPGHYTQFLYGPAFPSKVRKVFGATTNSEGWAHYCEQMMLDEGYKREDPRYRLAQLQDALLRNVRFIVGIQMHSEGMSVEQAQQLFETAAYQPPSVAVSEAKRGTSDPTYGYYTLGKLMVLKLRDDYRASRGDAFTLRDFHDRFLKLGPLPIPLVRRAMLGSTGDILPAD